MEALKCSLIKQTSKLIYLEVCFIILKPTKVMNVSKIFLFFLFFISVSCSRKNYIKHEFLSTNSSFKNHLNDNTLQKLNDNTIIDFIFKSMNNKIIINNSENYYYYEFLLNGRHFKGNIGLLINERDNNTLSIGCEEVTNIEEKYYKPISIEKALNINDGLSLEKLNINNYIINYKGKKIEVIIDEKLFNSKSYNKLNSSYQFIGKSFDDSGLTFNLCYNDSLKHFLYTLDEVEKSNLSHFVKLNSNIVIEIRTGFAFYKNYFNDKILIGVLKKNEIANNLYDGPFDQLPDNQILESKINLGKLIKDSNINYTDDIDIYGNFENNNEYRVAISAYYSYNNIEDLMNHFYEFQSNNEDENSIIKYLTKFK